MDHCLVLFTARWDHNQLEASFSDTMSKNLYKAVIDELEISLILIIIFYAKRLQTLWFKRLNKDIGSL